MTPEEIPAPIGDTRPKPFVFVLMPFDPKFDDLYKLGIKPACEQAGAYAERVDEQIFHESILERVYNQISKADILVADMTGRNANVFYETGYAHALGKRVILLTQNSDDIPFDLKHYPHIIYAGRIVDLIPELEKRVRWCIQNPTSSRRDNRSTLVFRVNGSNLEGNTIINLPWHGEVKPDQYYTVSLNVDIHNLADREIRVAEFRLGVMDFGITRFHRKRILRSPFQDQVLILVAFNRRVAVRFADGLAPTFST